MRWELLALVLVAGCGEVEVRNEAANSLTEVVEPSSEESLDDGEGNFFPVATGPSVAKCAREAKAFNTNRRVEQALKVDTACQAEMNGSDLSPDCREYAVSVWTASGKFQRAMEADAGQGANLAEVIRYHRESAFKAAPGCKT